MFALAFGVGTKNSQGEWLEAYFPSPQLMPSSKAWECFSTALDYSNGQQIYELDDARLSALVLSLESNGLADLCSIAISFRSSKQPRVAVMLESDDVPSTILEVYLKLHLLSHRLVKPHSVNLKGVFSILPNVAWTSHGAIDVKELAQYQTRARLAGEVLEVFSVDKFPKLANYVVPTGVRIADTARVRLGAYIGEGTTIMHEGFVNFNAGTLGVGMIEGRISSGVVIGDRSDLGGGCSTMGTLSGGNSAIISIGRECLVGANAGVGIALGDRCTIESGLYVTAGTKVHVYDNQNNLVKITKAKELSGSSDMLFRRNSLNGAVEVICNKSAIKLNDELHKNN